VVEREREMMMMWRHLSQEEIDPWPFVDVVHDTPSLEDDLDHSDLESRSTPASARDVWKTAETRGGVHEGLVEVEDKGFCPVEERKR
jgi:hypothetical protein